MNTQDFDFDTWMTDTQEMRDRRETALEIAVELHGEMESQQVFRADELENVIVSARRIFDWIMHGDE